MTRITHFRAGFLVPVVAIPAAAIRKGALQRVLTATLGMTARAFGVPASAADPAELGADLDFTEARRGRAWFPASVILVLLAFPLMPARCQTLLREANNMGEIETTRLVVLGEVDGNEGFVSLPVDVGRRKNGEWVVTDQITAEEVQLFSASGQWLRKIGREGAGPGEFQAAWFVDVVQDDGLLVWDSGLGRITRFDSQLDVIGITPVRFRATSVAFLQSGEIVANAHLNGPLRVGLPLHLVDSVGAIIRSFGAEPPIRNWGNYYQTMRRLAPAGPKAVWSANLTDYSIERWTTLGVKTAHLVREVPWFPSIDDWGTKRNKEDPPEPRIYAIHESEDGLVWVLIHIADEAWEEGYEERLSPWGEMTRIISDDNRVYDSVVEVVDPQSAVVLASARLDAAFRGFAGDGLLFSRVYRDETFPVLEIWKLHIR